MGAIGETASGNLPDSTYAVVLSCPDEDTLDQLACKLETAQEPVHRVVEQHGRYAGHLMALGLEPGPKSQRGKLLSSLPLIRLDQFQEFLDYQLRRDVQYTALLQRHNILKDKVTQRPSWWARIKTAWRAA